MPKMPRKRRNQVSWVWRKWGEVDFFRADVTVATGSLQARGRSSGAAKLVAINGFPSVTRGRLWAMSGQSVGMC